MKRPGFKASYRDVSQLCAGPSQHGMQARLIRAYMLPQRASTCYVTRSERQRRRPEHSGSDALGPGPRATVQHSYESFKTILINVRVTKILSTWQGMLYFLPRKGSCHAQIRILPQNGRMEFMNSFRISIDRQCLRF